MFWIIDIGSVVAAGAALHQRSQAAKQVFDMSEWVMAENATTSVRMLQLQWRDGSVSGQLWALDHDAAPVFIADLGRGTTPFEVKLFMSQAKPLIEHWQGYVNGGGTVAAWQAHSQLSQESSKP
jgi:hypothetical protein